MVGPDRRPSSQQVVGLSVDTEGGRRRTRCKAEPFRHRQIIQHRCSFLAKSAPPPETYTHACDLPEQWKGRDPGPSSHATLLITVFRRSANEVKWRQV